MKFISIIYLLFLLSCGKDQVTTEDSVNTDTPPQTNPQPNPQPKDPEKNPDNSQSEDIVLKPTINCPIGLQQDVPDWFNYEKWQRLNHNYSSSNIYLYVDKSNGTWKLQNENDPDNIELIACGLFLNFDYLKDYTSGKIGYGTLDIFYKSLTEDTNWTCWYEYYYNEPNSSPKVPKNESMIMVNCGTSDDLFDTEISYYFRSFGF